MERAKICLPDAARNRGCSTDYLLALAEAEQLDVFACIGPFTAELKDWRGGQLSTRQQPLTRTIDSYTVLLPQEIRTLRSGKPVTIRVLREEGNENGCKIPSLSDEDLLFWLLEPQTIGTDQVHIYEETKVGHVDLNPSPQPETSTKDGVSARHTTDTDERQADRLDQREQSAAEKAVAGSFLANETTPLHGGLSRNAIQNLFPEISKDQWRGLWGREKKNGLSDCRTGTGRDTRYEPMKLALWIGNNRSEVTVTETIHRIQGKNDNSNGAVVPTAHDPFGLSKRSR